MSEHITLKSMPSLLALYAKVLFSKKAGWQGEPLKQTIYSLKGHTLSMAQVANYHKVCRFDNDQQLAPTFLYTQVFRLQIALFVSDVVPFPLFGLIHLKNSIRQYRPIESTEVFDLSCGIINSEETERGVEFELLSKAYVDGELVWQSVSTYLYRNGNKAKRVRPPKASDLDWQDAKVWDFEHKTSFAYAKASSDYNLIHLHPMLAKPFGFEKVIAHGMWSKALCVAALPTELLTFPLQIDVEFKLPLLLPTSVSFNFVEGAPTQFELRDKKGRRPHLIGTLSYPTKESENV